MVDAGDVAVAVGSEAFDLWLVMLKFRAWLVVILLLVVGMSYFAMSDWGIDDEGRKSSSSVNSDTGWRHYSVVAPVDTGINVYHDHFRTSEVYPDWLLDSLGVTKTCDMTFDGSWQERYEADKESCWDNITTSDIVYFAGTKIIGTSPDGETDIHILDDPSDGHGTAVTGAVLDANPDAVIFFVEGFSTKAVLAASNLSLIHI